MSYVLGGCLPEFSVIHTVTSDCWPQRIGSHLQFEIDWLSTVVFVKHEVLGHA